jgi:galactose-1-phosphate uridylyltransferase
MSLNETSNEYDSQATIPVPDEYASMDIYLSQALGLNDDEPESPPVTLKKKPRKLPTFVTKATPKVTTKKVKATTVATVVALSDFVIDFLEEHSASTEMIDAFRSTETQGQLAGLLKFHTPAAKTKKRKDPNAPKRPKSAYICYCNARRPRLKSKYPDKKMPEITKFLATRWKDMSDEKKAKYVTMADEDKERYADEMKDYVPTPESELPAPRKRGRPSTKKKREGPVRARTSYILFCSEMRQQTAESHPEMSGKQVTAELGRLWKNDYSTKAARTKWRRAARKDKIRFAEEMLEWEEGHPVVANPTPAGHAGKSGKSIFAEERHSYLTRKHPELTEEQKTQKIAKAWKMMTPDLRNAYAELSNSE